MRPTRNRVSGPEHPHLRVDLLRGLAPREVYRDPKDYSLSGGLLHRRFTLIRIGTIVPIGGRFVFCDTAL